MMIIYGMGLKFHCFKFSIMHICFYQQDGKITSFGLESIHSLRYYLQSKIQHIQTHQCDDSRPFNADSSNGREVDVVYTSRSSVSKLNVTQLKKIDEEIASGELFFNK